ncbi:MAG: hypothetical protein CMH83_06005 [Nocardioides sp.]|nr:hypothetical protein [Nocardioides sp.]
MTLVFEGPRDEVARAVLLLEYCGTSVMEGPDVHPEVRRFFCGPETDADEVAGLLAVWAPHVRRTA